MHSDARTQLTARIAYTLFEQRGAQHGRAHEDWRLAEELISWVELALSLVAPPAPQPVAKPGGAAPARGAPLAAADARAQALELLAQAVASEGRAALAERLGYASSSSVGKILRGQRRLTEDLVDRIQAACAPAPLQSEQTQSEPTLRLLPKVA